MEKVKCTDLWKELIFEEPNSNNVINAKERISRYSKDDWAMMAKEATYMTEMLAELVKYRVPIHSKLAERGFDALVEHLENWFIKVDRKNAEKFGFVCHNHPRYVLFFDQYEPGLGKYLGKVIVRYAKKLPETISEDVLVDSEDALVDTVQF